jgi:SAM-dependent methyltransferase
MLSLEKQDAYRRRYAQTRPGWSPATQVYEDAISALLRPASRVLDLGCGRGGVMERLHGRAGSVAGVDPDIDSLLLRRLPGGWVTCATGERLPFATAAFDLVSCSWVLEHLCDPGAVFSEVARVLVPGGHFLLLTPNARHPLIWANRLLRWTKGALVGRLYGRREVDTFPARYRANVVRRIDQLADAGGMRRVSVQLIGDPSYLAFGEMLFRLSCLLERLTPASRRVHIVAEYVAGS